MSRAVHPSITKPSIAKPSNASHLAFYHQAVHCKPSIVTSMSRPSLHCQVVHRKLSITTLPSHPAPYSRAIHRQAIHCRAVHCAELSIASHSLRHCRAIHCSITKPFFAICSSRAVHRCIVELSSSIASCQSQHHLAVQCFIAELSIASRRPLRPLRHCRALHRLLRAAYCNIAEPSIATLPIHPALYR